MSLFSRDYSGFEILPENSRYFQYKGLPYVSFTYSGQGFGHRVFPKDPTIHTPARRESAAQFGNALYVVAHPTWSRATYREVLEKLHDENHWAAMREVAEDCLSKDMMLTIICWSYKWRYDIQEFDGSNYSDMLWADPDQPEMVDPISGTNGSPLMYANQQWSRKDLHLLLIDKLVENTWDLPNVVYNFMWEYQHAAKRPDRDRSGAMHAWWVDAFKERGRARNPDVSHLFSIQYQKWKEDMPDEISPHHADFQHFEGASTRSDPVEFQMRKVPLCHWSIGEVDGPQASISWIRDRICLGFQPAENFEGIQEQALNYMIPARWYMENIKSWEDEDFLGNLPRFAALGDEINIPSLPSYTPSARPSLEASTIYPTGAFYRGDHITFSCIYNDPDGDRPALAEVWVDRNGDGRFDPDYPAGERIGMIPQMRHSGPGTLYEANAEVADGDQYHYVFRFADEHWWPPELTGLAGPTWYAHRRQEKLTDPLWEQADWGTASHWDSPWFGAFTDARHPWVFHEEHGWLYHHVTGNLDQGIYLFDAALGRWWWTAENMYPYMYVFPEDVDSREEGWLYYFSGATPGERWFLDLNTMQFINESQLGS